MMAYIKDDGCLSEKYPLKVHFFIYYYMLLFLRNHIHQGIRQSHKFTHLRIWRQIIEQLELILWFQHACKYMHVLNVYQYQIAYELHIDKSSSIFS